MQPSSAFDSDENARLTTGIYNELRSLARRYLRGERPGHTLQPTAIVNEAYLRLAGVTSTKIENRTQFFGIAAHLMREVLVDYARKKGAVKRFGAQHRVPIEDAPVLEISGLEELLALHEVLEVLNRLYPTE